MLNELYASQGFFSIFFLVRIRFHGEVPDDYGNQVIDKPGFFMYFMRDTEVYRSGHNGPDSKSGSPHGLVGSNPTASANEKSSNHTGFWIFLFCPSPGFCSRFGLFFPKVWRELCAIFNPFLRFDPTGFQSGRSAVERSCPPWPAPTRQSQQDAAPESPSTASLWKSRPCACADTVSAPLQICFPYRASSRAYGGWFLPLTPYYRSAPESANAQTQDLQA